jgi:hypothetical protein
VEPSDRLDFIILVVALVATVLLPGAAGPAQPEPALEIDSRAFDFGLVPDHCTLVHQTWLRSTGEDTLGIADIKTGCSCLASPLRSTRLAPGDSVLLTLYWHIGTADSRIQQVPYLMSNDKAGPHRLLLQAGEALDGDGLSAVDCRPMKIDFAETEKRKDYRRIFTIRNNADSDQAVSLVSYESDAFQLELPDTVEAGSSATGIVTLSNEFADKEFERSFTLEMVDNHEKVSRVSLTVTRGDFSFRPTLTTNIDTPDSVNTKR